MSGVHPSAGRGYASGADTYVRGRPHYPVEVSDWLTSALAIGHGRNVLDLGAGTGKFTPLLLGTGAAVTAVEPVAAMRERFATAFTELTALAGSAEAIPLADGAMDAVICAQSFHWFATPPALAEIRRVLRPEGALGLIWNVRDERVPWVAKLTALVDAYEDDTPRYRTGAWRRLFPAEGFSPLRERRFGFTHVGSPEDVIVNRVLSVSFIAALPKVEQAGLARRVRTLIDATPELAGKAEVAYPYETVAFACRKVG